MHNRRLNMKFRWDKKYLYWGVWDFSYGRAHTGISYSEQCHDAGNLRSGHRLSADTGCEFSGTEDLLSSYEEKEDGYQ